MADTNSRGHHQRICIKADSFAIILRLKCISWHDILTGKPPLPLASTVRNRKLCTISLVGLRCMQAIARIFDKEHAVLSRKNKRTTEHACELLLARSHEVSVEVPPLEHECELSLTSWTRCTHFGTCVQRTKERWNMHASYRSPDRLSSWERSTQFGTCLERTEVSVEVPPLEALFHSLLDGRTLPRARDRARQWEAKSRWVKAKLANIEQSLARTSPACSSWPRIKLWIWVEYREYRNLWCVVSNLIKLLMW